MWMIVAAVSSAAAEKPVDLAIRVVDASGVPVSDGRVRFPVEDEIHRVHTATGEYRTQALYLRDGSERFFRLGETVTVEVFAPGFERREVTLTVPEKRRHTRKPVDLQLTPRGTVAADTAVGERTLGAHAQWVDLEQTFAADPTLPNRQSADAAGVTVAELAREWMDLGGEQHALELCLASSSRRHCGL